MEAVWVPIVGSVCALAVLPALVFNFIYRMKKLRVEEKELEARSELLRLELERDKLRLALREDFSETRS